jgi:ferrochelatase
MIGWPTILSPSMREERDAQARISQEEAKRLGASN